MLVFLAEGPCPPAPLVPLLSPDVFLLQTSNAADLSAIGTLDGTAVIAVLPEGAAEWVHDPAGGDTLGQRLTIRAMPETDGVRSMAGLSAWRQREDLAQLAVLAEAARGGAKVGAAAATGRASDNGAQGEEPTEPVDLLAAWLIRQADLTAAD